MSSSSSRLESGRGRFPSRRKEMMASKWRPHLSIITQPVVVGDDVKNKLAETSKITASYLPNYHFPPTFLSTLKPPPSPKTNPPTFSISEYLHATREHGLEHGVVSGEGGDGGAIKAPTHVQLHVLAPVALYECPNLR